MSTVESCLYPSQQLFSTTEKQWMLPCAELPQCSDYSRSQNLLLPNGNHDLGMILREETKSGNPNGRINEDSTLILPMGKGRELVAVLDGASSRKEIAGLEKYHLSGACYVSHLVYCNFAKSPEYQSLTLKEELSAGDIMRTVNGWLHSKLSLVEGVDYRDVLSVPGMAASFSLIDAHKNEVSVAHVADTTAFAVYENGDITELTVNQNERFDIETLDLLISLSETHHLTPRQVLETPELKSVIKRQLSESFTRKINTPGGCGILNGMDELISNNLIYETSLPITPNLRKLILASDGAVLPYQLNGLSHDSVLKRLSEDTETHPVGNQFEFHQKGAAELIRDAEYEKVLRLKPSDDATIIEVDFSS